MGAAVRVELLDGVDAIVVRAEQRDLLLVDQRREPTLALEVGDRAQPNPEGQRPAEGIGRRLPGGALRSR